MLQLEKKKGNAKCNQHNGQIFQININSNVEQQNRILCQECDFEGNAKNFLSLKKVEIQLFERYSKEELQLNQDNQKFQILSKYIKDSIEQIEKKILEMVKAYQTQLDKLKKSFEDHFKKVSDTPMKKLLDEIIKKDSLDNKIFEQIGVLLSQGEMPIEASILKDISQQLIKSFKTIDVLENAFNLEIKNKGEVTEILQNLDPIPINLNESIVSWNNPIELQGHKHSVRAVAISQDDKYLASGDYNSTINIWKLSDRSLLKQFEGDIGKRIQDIVFARNKSHIAVSQYSYNALCDILIFKFDQTDQHAQFRLKGHQAAVWRILFTSDSQYLLSGSDDKTVRLWNVSTAEAVNRKELSSVVNGISLSPDQQTVLCGCGNGQAYIFDRELRSQLSNWQTEENYIGGTSFTTDAKTLVFGHKKKISLWDKETKTKLKDFQINSDIWCVIANFKLLDNLLISNDGEIKIWNIEDGEVLCTLPVSGGYEWEFDRQVAVSSDLRYIVTGGKNSKVKIYQRSK